MIEDEVCRYADDLKIAALQLQMQNTEFLARVHEAEVSRLRQFFSSKATEAQEHLGGMYRLECLLGTNLRFILYTEGGDLALAGLSLVVDCPGEVTEHIDFFDIKALGQRRRCSD